MLGAFVSAFVEVRIAYDTLRERGCTERGASMVEYALLVGLIAVVCMVIVAALGTSIANLFSTTNNCIGNAANC